MILLIGGDAKLSGELISVFKKNNVKYCATSRRKNLKINFIYLDLNKVDDFKIPPNISKVIFVGGVTDYKLCEKEPEYAEFINCNQIPKLASKMIQMNIPVYFISTNTVFTNDKGMPNEYDNHNPSSSYSKLKSVTEKNLYKFTPKDLHNNISIIRLTKNINLFTEPFYDWIKDLKKNKLIYPFKDLFFSPVLFNNSANAIFKIVFNNYKGNFHFSGEKDFSYDQFAYLLVKKLGFDKDLVSPILSAQKNVKLIYNNNITALNMEITSKSTGLKPVMIEEIIKYFADNYEKIN